VTARLTSELRAEKDSLMAEQARLRQNIAQLQVLNQNLQSFSQGQEVSQPQLTVVAILTDDKLC
jgi:hypothetical protein